MHEIEKTARSSVEEYGTPAQRSKFFTGLVMYAQRHNRYGASEEADEHLRASLKVAVQRATKAWERNDLEQTQRYLGESIELAQALSYL